MARSVKLSDELVREAELNAEIERRSVGGQIEYWAQLGRRIASDTRISAAELLALQRHDRQGEALDAINETRRGEILESLQKLVSDVRRESFMRKLTAREQPRYGIDPANPQRLMRIDADGSRTYGRLINNEFVAESQEAAAVGAA